MMDSEVFRFKHFEVAHGRSSMKVGVDAVLLGAWAQKDNPRRILDVGTGCGVIALILAQRYPMARIEAIDIDADSVEEAAENFENSPWSRRMQCMYCRFPEDILKANGKYDLIVSNPPYFNSGISNPSTAREVARHQGSLSMSSLLEHSATLLAEDGHISLIFPAEFRDKAMEVARMNGCNLVRECYVRNNMNRPEKRIMMEFGKTQTVPQEEHITLFDGGAPSASYLRLCKDLYLKF